jgi:hypothetical protein
MQLEVQARAKSCDFLKYYRFGFMWSDIEDLLAAAPKFDSAT